MTVYARWSADRIRYWAEDSYEDHRVRFWPEATRRPLALARLIDGLDGLSVDVRDCDDRFEASPEFWYHEGGRDFVEIASAFYPMLGAYYEQRWDRLAAEQAKQSLRPRLRDMPSDDAFGKAILQGMVPGMPLGDQELREWERSAAELRKLLYGDAHPQ